MDYVMTEEEWRKEQEEKMRTVQEGNKGVEKEYLEVLANRSRPEFQKAFQRVKDLNRLISRLAERNEILKAKIDNFLLSYTRGGARASPRVSKAIKDTKERNLGWWINVRIANELKDKAFRSSPTRKKYREMIKTCLREIEGLRGTLKEGLVEIETTELDKDDYFFVAIHDKLCELRDDLKERRDGIQRLKKETYFTSYREEEYKEVEPREEPRISLWRTLSSQSQKKIERKTFKELKKDLEEIW